jgi:hypothetical protein
MSINLHNLYLGNAVPTLPSSINSHLLEFHLSKSKNFLRLNYDFSEAVYKDAKVALDWATPAIQYSIFDTPIFNHSQTSSYRTIEGSAVATALLFESPFATEKLLNSCDRVGKALSCGAYLHRYSKDGVEVDDIHDAVDVVRQYLS